MLGACKITVKSFFCKTLTSQNLKIMMYNINFNAKNINVFINLPMECLEIKG